MPTEGPTSVPTWDMNTAPDDITGWQYDIRIVLLQKSICRITDMIVNPVIVNPVISCLSIRYVEALSNKRFLNSCMRTYKHTR